jgi:hypothetical protein
LPFSALYSIDELLDTWRTEHIGPPMWLSGDFHESSHNQSFQQYKHDDTYEASADGFQLFKALINSLECQVGTFSSFPLMQVVTKKQ